MKHIFGESIGQVESILLIAAMIVGAFVFILGMGLFVMWIKYSWIERNNSLNYTGRDLTERMFHDNGINPEIKSSFFYSKYWNHNAKRNTYRLRPWTHDRRSIWTLMEAGQQAYATIIRNTKKKEFWLAFRMPQLIMWAGGLVGAGLIAYGWYAYENLAIGHSASFWNTWVWIALGFLVLLTSMTYATCWRAWQLRKHVVPMISNIGFAEHELRAIQSIFNWAFLYAFANAILQTIRIALEIAEKANQNSK